jgi:beta-glucosidase
MTLDDKASLLSGTGFSTAALPRLGIPAMNFSDGPHGVRTDGNPPMTAFPVGISIAATFSPDLIQQMGMVLGEEARGDDKHVLLGPAVNIQRFPLGGRNFEYFTEDPYLNGVIGAAWVKGVQSEGVGASVKHFVANNQELNRNFSNSVIDERTLHEIYLAGFEKIVRDAKPWTIMASYNRINGTYATENSALLRDVLKGDWGFDGLVMSDWGAVHSTAAVINGGTDLEMPTGQFLAPFAKDAVLTKQVEESTIDDAVRRLLRLAIRTGALDARHPVGTIGTPAHLAMAQKVAEQSIVLLKNDRNLLPLAANIHKLVLIGPNVLPFTIQGSGSSQVSPTRVVSLIDAIKAQAGTGVQITYVPGVPNDDRIPTADSSLFSVGKDRAQSGLKLQYLDQFGRSLSNEVESHPFDGALFPNVAPDKFKSAQRLLAGTFWADTAGEYKFGVTGPGEPTLSIDDSEVVSGNKNLVPYVLFDVNVPEHVGSVTLKPGPHNFRLQVLPGADIALPAYISVGVQRPVGSIAQAVAAAKAADQVVLVVGSSPFADTEGEDRASMELFGQQNAMVSAVLAANPKTVVVLNTGGPVTMPWVNQSHALIEAFYPGQEGATALARILFGAVNPSGRLPETFPLRLADNPAYTSYPNDREAIYGEGVFVGYRWYDKRQMDVLFPFGHGLSYTNFGYAGLKLPSQSRNDTPVSVSLTITNKGTREGAEVVQLYVAPENAPLPRPLRELKGIARVNLASGASQSVSFLLTPRDFSYWDVVTHKFVAAAGKYRIDVGASSRDIRQSGEITLAQGN